MISIIIPLYNKAPYIVRAVHSVLKQRYTDYELIIINDGSKDDSLKVVQRLVAGLNCKEQRVKIQIVNQKNVGVAITRNRGVELAKGDYVAFLDADDWWRDDFLTHMAQLIAQYPDAGAYGSGYYTVRNNKKREFLINSIKKDGEGLIDFCNEFTQTNISPFDTDCLVIKKTVFSELSGFNSNLKLGEDLDLWIRIYLKYLIAFVNKPLSYYNQDVDVANRAMGHLHKPENNIVFNLNYLQEYEKSNYVYKRFIDLIRCNMLFAYYINGNYKRLALVELDKIDWSKQPTSAWRKYHCPLWFVRLEDKFMRYYLTVLRRLKIHRQ